MGVAAGNPQLPAITSGFLPCIDAGLQVEQFPSPYDSFPFPHLAVIDQHQIDYLVFELRRCVVSLVVEGQTPFLHPDLYHDTLPDTYQDLLSICSLYNQMNSSVIVFRMLFVKLRKLISSSRKITRVEDWLLAVQTLIMYQIIRVFDGDVKQQESAEDDFDLLGDWSHRLQEASSEGGSWLLMESIRRTLLVSIIFRCLHKLMKHGLSELVPEMSLLPVSENISGWEKGEGGSLVTYASFVEDWNQGKVTSVDAYEMLLLKACRHTVLIA